MGEIIQGYPRSTVAPGTASWASLELFLVGRTREMADWGVRHG